MTRVCVLIGEGKSEKAFFSSLLMHKLGFTESESKNCITYQSVDDPDLYWIFPIPSYGSTHKGGCDLLEEKGTYIKCKTIVANYKWLFGNNPEIHYKIITDSDNESQQLLDARKGRIKSAFDSASVTCVSDHIGIVHIEIESWFIAGLDLSFPYLKNQNLARKLIAENVDTLLEPKERLDEILVDSVSGDRQRIGADFGEHINMPQAEQKSQSFKLFISNLKTNNLIV